MVEKRRVAAIAHRGVREQAPENTLPALQRAIEMGLDFVEIDVHSTLDGCVVLSHDSTVDRMTDGSGRIRDMTLQQVKSLDAGVKFGEEFEGTRIPTLDEALELCRGRIAIYLDLKDAPVGDVIRCLDEHGMIRDTVVYSSLSVLMEIKRERPDLAVMPGPGSWLALPGMASLVAKALPAEYIDSNLVDWTSERVEEAHAAGAKVFMDTLGQRDHREGMIEAIEMGADGIDTDHPDVLLAVLEELGVERWSRGS